MYKTLHTILEADWLLRGPIEPKLHQHDLLM